MIIERFTDGISNWFRQKDNGLPKTPRGYAERLLEEEIRFDGSYGPVDENGSIRIEGISESKLREKLNEYVLNEFIRQGGYFNRTSNSVVIKKGEGPYRFLVMEPITDGSFEVDGISMNLIDMRETNNGQVLTANWWWGGQTERSKGAPDFVDLRKWRQGRMYGVGGRLNRDEEGKYSGIEAAIKAVGVFFFLRNLVLWEKRETIVMPEDIAEGYEKFKNEVWK